MSSVSPSLVRAARGMLDWSMTDLAKAARVSISTVKRYEIEGGPAVSHHLAGLMQDALETEGICFLSADGDGPGLRYKRR